MKDHSGTKAPLADIRKHRKKQAFENATADFSESTSAGADLTVALQAAIGNRACAQLTCIKTLVPEIRRKPG